MGFGSGAGGQAQRAARPTQPAHQRAQRDGKNGGGLGIGQAFKSDQQHDFLLFNGQGINGAGQFGQRDMTRLGRRTGGFGDAVEVDRLATPASGTPAVAIDIEQDGEQPGADGTGGPEQSAPGNGAFKAVLHQIVGQDRKSNV